MSTTVPYSDDEFRIRVAGAPYVPRANQCDQLVHWLYEPKLLYGVNKVDIWCREHRPYNEPVPSSFSELSTYFDNAVPCPVCSTLAPLPGGEPS